MWCTASLPLHLWKIRCNSAIISPCRVGNYSLVYPWTMSTCFPFRHNRIFISRTKLTSCHDAIAWRWGIRQSELSEKLRFLWNFNVVYFGICQPFGVTCCFLHHVERPTILTRKMRQYVLSTHTHISTKVYGVTYQKKAIPILTVVRALNVTRWSVAVSSASWDSWQ